MTGPTVAVSGVGVGGAVIFDLPDYLQPPSGVTFMAMSRAVSGVSGLGAFTTFYSGMPLPKYVDAGDGTPAPLFSGSAYVWNVTDDRGTTQVGPIQPLSMVTSAPDYFTNLLIRLLQGSLNCLTLPNGIKPVQITTKMPQQGLGALPFIVVNLDLIQQTEVEIGKDTPFSNNNNILTLFSNAKRIWRVSVFSADAQERDYYRDTLLMNFQVLRMTVFTVLGYDVSHSFQAASGTDSKEWDGHSPGFYYADLMLELDGVFLTAITTNFGVIDEIDVGAHITPNSLMVSGSA